MVNSTPTISFRSVVDNMSTDVTKSSLQQFKEALQTHDWLLISSSNSQVVECLNDLAQNHRFSELARYSGWHESAIVSYLKDPVCDLEVGKSLITMVEFEAHEIMKIKNELMLKHVAINLDYDKHIALKLELFARFLELERLDLCDCAISPSDVAKILHLGSSGYDNLSTEDIRTHSRTTGYSLEYLIHCHRQGLTAPFEWVEMGKTVPHNSYDCKLTEFGADAVVVASNLGLDAVRKHYAEAVMTKPSLNDYDHYTKLENSGTTLRILEMKKHLGECIAKVNRRNTPKEERATAVTLIVSSMCHGFDIHEDLLYASELMTLGHDDLITFACHAANHLWKHRAKEQRGLIITLLNATLDDGSGMRKAAEHLPREILMKLKNGRELVFGKDLGL